MPTPIQSPNATAALVDAFGVKGRYLLQLDEVVVPVAIVEDVRASEIKGTGFSRHGALAGVAAQFPGLQAGGNQNFDFLPKQFIVSAAAAGEFRVTINDGSGVASALQTPFPLAGVNRWDPRRPTSPVRPIIGQWLAGPIGTDVLRFNYPVANEDLLIDLTGWRIPFPAMLQLEHTVANTLASYSLTWDVLAVDR